MKSSRTPKTIFDTQEKSYSRMLKITNINLLLVML